MSQSFRDPRKLPSIDSHLGSPVNRPCSPPDLSSRFAVRNASSPAQQIGRNRSGSDSSQSEYSTRVSKSKSVSNLRRMVQPRVPFSSLYTGDPRYPPMSPYPESSRRKGGSEREIKHSHRPKTSSVTDDEETFGQERPLPQLSAKTLPQKNHRGKERAQRPNEEEQPCINCASEQRASQAVEKGEHSPQNRVRKSISFNSHSLPLPSRSVYDTARVRTASPAPVKASSASAESGHSFDKRMSSSILSRPRTSPQSLKPALSAHELCSKPDRRDVTPTDSVMEGTDSSNLASLQRQNTVVSRKESARQASSTRVHGEREQSQVAPRITSPPPPPPAPSPKHHPKKSAWKSLSSSISKATDRSRRSISGLFGLMSRDGPHTHVKTVDEAMAETTLFLNGFSKLSAFKRDYNGAMLRELEEVQRKYKGDGGEGLREEGGPGGGHSRE